MKNPVLWLIIAGIVLVVSAWLRILAGAPWWQPTVSLVIAAVFFGAAYRNR